MAHFVEEGAHVVEGQEGWARRVVGGRGSREVADEGDGRKLEVCVCGLVVGDRHAVCGSFQR